MACSDTQAETAAIMRLPAELRNNIYRLVLATRKPIKVLSSRPDTDLLQTCKQIRQKAISIFYGENKVELSIAAGTILNTIRWVSSVDKRYAHKIKKIHISCELETVPQFNYYLFKEIRPFDERLSRSSETMREYPKLGKEFAQKLIAAGVAAEQIEFDKQRMPPLPAVSSRDLLLGSFQEAVESHSNEVQGAV